MTQLLQGERAILGVRQSWSVLIPTVVSAVLAVTVVIVLAHIVPTTVLSHSTHSITTYSVLIVAVVAIAVVGFSVLQWRFSTYTLTTHRIIVSRGVVSRVTESIGLDRVQDTTIRRSLGQRMIGCGDIEIESAGRDGIELLHRIPKPEHFYNALMEAMEEYRHPGAAGSAPAAPTPMAPQGGL